jgi:Na+-translocating ferredoxin:NAD+ oxidoreductase RnfD subunit
MTNFKGEGRKMNVFFKELITGDPARKAAGAGLADGREMSRYLTTAGMAAVPCLLLAGLLFGGRIWGLFSAAALAGTAVEILFALARRRPLRGGGSLVFAAWLVLLLPPEVPLWMVCLGSVFGTLFGKEVFGGTGHHLFSPVLIAKGALLYSFPQVVSGTYFGSMFGAQPLHGWISASLLTLLSGSILLFIRKENGRIWFAILVSAALTGMLLQKMGGFSHASLLEMMVSDGFLIGACILACDPATSPRRPAAIWMYGLFIGTLAVLMRAFSNYSEAMLSAVLLGNLFTPVFDALANLKKQACCKREVPL